MQNLLAQAIAVIVTTAFLPGVSFAQGQSTTYKEVKGWTINQYVQSESSDAPSCSAVHVKDHINAIRIERFNNGYFFGLNGLSRDQEGAQYPLAYWFDGDRDREFSGEARFIGDTAYPLDDWLSHFVPIDADPSPINSISALSTMSFAFEVPGNRTGDDEVTTTFELNGSAAAILALDECYEVANAITVTAAPSEPLLSETVDIVSDCPDDGPRLPGSGVCQGRGVNYLNIVEGRQPELLEGCEWKLNETPLPGGDYLLYLAAACGQHISQLEFSAGAHFADVTVASSAMSNGEPGSRIIRVGSADENDPYKNILLYVEDEMRDPDAFAGCKVRSGFEGWPADAVVVDVLSDEENAQSQEMRSACGSFGFNGESQAYWRVFDGYSWFFDLGQDAYQDIDPRSLTIVKSEYLPN
ncbi:MAG: hypothetical protein COA62_14645 [Rhodobiaceae bacterium]|nr:MAG: hypothetical protein COA62_14645 [Rhodobiaceae bacterium]